MKEIWKDVVGFEGLYEVSSKGNVFSLGRVIKKRSGKGDDYDRFSYRCPSKMLKPWRMGSGGHFYVGLRQPLGKMQTLAVHRLMLEAFVGSCPEGMECCHNDGNPNNNILSNLRWDTYANNQRDRKRHGNDHYSVSAKGEKQWCAKMTEWKVRKLRWLYRTRNYSGKVLAAYFGLKESTTWDIIKRRTWKHVK